ncbi:unnamed protein product, partial [Mesorhabditis belari]|uniref:Saposin B-type domain-containing protein n=1 Tax=Mesorhabditis belari TaxID=2138241 RepID=A0AAF3EC31_9BILA
MKMVILVILFGCIFAQPGDVIERQISNCRDCFTLIDFFKATFNEDTQPLSEMTEEVYLKMIIEKCDEGYYDKYIENRDQQKCMDYVKSEHEGFNNLYQALIADGDNAEICNKFYSNTPIGDQSCDSWMTEGAD